MVTHAKYPRQKDARNEPDDAIVECSMHSAIDSFTQSDIPKKYWDVMLFGGGIIHHMPGQLSLYGMLGWQNIISALHVFQKKNLLISSGNFGGFGGRRLHFWSATGQAKCKRLMNSYGGISVSSKTPAWLLLESMKTRVQQLQSDTTNEMLFDDIEAFPA